MPLILDPERMRVLEVAFEYGTDVALHFDIAQGHAPVTGSMFVMTVG